MSSQAEQIKSRLGVTDVVQTYIKLQKAGINFKANCPFHNEKTPSFFVSPSRESWHCFGCNRGGDIFSFVMEIEGMEFPEALKILAHRAGVELKPMSMESAGQRSERTRLVQSLEEAKKFYEGNLKKNQDVISYLKGRGLKGETAKAFGIGFAPDGWRNLHDFLKTKGFSGSEMEKAGLAVRRDQTQDSGLRTQDHYYDRFRSRIMFPLNNFSGQIVGFSGRIFGKEDDKMGKYINTPQTILYDKSKILYGFDKAKTEIKKKDFCILVEGQMDVIMSHQAGFINTVAVSGTALTIEHLKAIKRLTDNLVMGFDGDEAGLRASQRGIDLALGEGIEVKVALIPSGKDPADAIKENPGNWEEAIKKAKHIIEFYLDSVSGRKEIEKTILPYIAVLPSEMEKARWVKEVAKKLSIAEEPVWEELKKARKLETGLNVVRPGRTEETRFQKAPQKSRFRALQDRLVGFLAWQKGTGDAELRGEMKEIIEKHKLKFGGESENLAFEAELFYNESNDLKGEFKGLSLEFEREKIKNRLEEITGQIRRLETAGDSEDNLQDSLNEFHELTKELTNFK